MHSKSRLDVGKSAAIHERVKKLVAKLAREHELSRAYLFGSVSRGDYNEGSDVDLLLVGDFREPFLDRFVKTRVKTRLPIEAFCYTKEELTRMKKQGNSFVAKALAGKRLI